MKILFVLTAVAISLSVIAQKVDESEIQIPYKHSPLFSFASKEGGRMSVYMDRDEHPGDGPELSMFRGLMHISLFASFDLEKYDFQASSKGNNDLSVTIRATGTPIVKVEDVEGYASQGYSTKKHYYKKGTCIVTMLADIKNSKGELLKTIVISDEHTPHITHFYDAALAKREVKFWKEYYSMNSNYRIYDSAYRLFQPAYFIGFNTKEQLDRAYTPRDADYAFMDVVRANAINDAMLNLNYMLKAGLEASDKTDVFKFYTISPKKDKEADRYAEEMKTGELLSKTLNDLKQNNYIITDAIKSSLQQVKTSYEALIKKSDKDLGQGMKSMFGGMNSSYYNALFNNGALTDLLLGNYSDAKEKMDRYEAAESVSAAFQFKKVAQGTNYKIQFASMADYRSKIDRGKSLMQLLNP